jgi:hypothetical protein
VAGKRNKGGRPTDMTEAAVAAIVAAVEQGVTREHAAGAAGIHRDTLRRWIAAGRRAKSGRFFAFFARLQAAEAKAAQTYSLVIRKAAGGHREETVKETVLPDGTVKRETTTRQEYDWGAAAWWLARRCPDDYGNQVELLRDLEARIRELEKARRGPTD